jgi:hypothetical protein
MLPRVTSDEFLGGRGLGNEIAFHIFDYPPEDERESATAEWPQNLDGGPRALPDVL